MTKGILGPLDAYLNFGEVTLSGSSELEFPNYIDMNTSNADHLEIVGNVSTKATGGTSVQLVLKGSNNDSDYTEFSTGPVVPLAELEVGGVVRVAIPRHSGYRYLKLFAKQAGSFSGGKINAWLDTYDAK